MSEPTAPEAPITPQTLEDRLRARAAKLRADAEQLKRQAEIEISSMLMTAAAIEAELAAADAEGQTPEGA